MYYAWITSIFLFLLGNQFLYGNLIETNRIIKKACNNNNNFITHTHISLCFGILFTKKNLVSLINDIIIMNGIHRENRFSVHLNRTKIHEHNHFITDNSFISIVSTAAQPTDFSFLLQWVKITKFGIFYMVKWLHH